jgi:Cu-Zn family superoxide dismutase
MNEQRKSSESRAWIVLCGLALCQAACGTARDDADAGSADSGNLKATSSGDSTTDAYARIHDANGRSLGRLTVRGEGAGIAIFGVLEGLPPGTHGFHVHDTGDCQAPFESAGQHWNPTNRQHGRENPGGPHQGDLPNIIVPEDSAVVLQVMTAGGILRGAGGLLDQDGAAVVIHAGPDDDRTDPAGNSGERIACGVIASGPPG